MEDLSNMNDFIKLSKQYYDLIRATIEPESKGKYVALSYELKKYWIGDTMTEALKNAKNEYPQKIFYVIQIGTDSIFSIQTVKKKLFQ